MRSSGTLHRRVLVGTASNLLGQGVVVICQLALIPNHPSIQRTPSMPACKPARKAESAPAGRLSVAGSI